MQNFKDYNAYQPKTKTIVTIGTFDGVHIGHQKIISQLLEITNQDNLESVILTFFPHPRMVLQKDRSIKLINTIEEKEVLLKKLGIDHLVVKEFTKDFSCYSALEFVEEILVNKLNVAHVIIGHDHRFGKGREADINDLVEFGKEYHFKVTEITAQEIDQVAVSSTKIRIALKDGNIKTVNTYLGYNFMITGKVTKGKGIGRQLNFPTANIKIAENYKLVPKQGAYIIKTVIEEKEIFGMLNIGINPTVNGTSESIEAHFFDFDKDIYNKTIQIQFLERLRDEQKFESVALLKEQLQKDKRVALQYIKQNHA